MSGRLDKTQQHSPGALALKAALRATVLPDRPVRVLDCYHGDGDIWDAVARVHPHAVEVVGIEIDRKRAKPGVLTGDNRRVLASMNLSRFDMIDLDAWGTPWEQLRQVSRSNFQGTVAVTWILTIALAGCGLWQDFGVPKAWNEEVQSLFPPNVEACRLWLGHLGWDKVTYQVRSGNHFYGMVGYDRFDRHRFDKLYQRLIQSGV